MYNVNKMFFPHSVSKSDKKKWNKNMVEVEKLDGPYINFVHPAVL